MRAAAVDPIKGANSMNPDFSAVALRTDISPLGSWNGGATDSELTWTAGGAA
jgi:hypothetical protein